MKLRPFELGLVIFFGVAVVLAFILINTYDGGGKKDLALESLKSGVSIWGTVSADVFSTILRDLSSKQDGFNKVSYTYIPQVDFEQRFVNALADQNPPDLVFIPHEELAALRSRLQPFPYESFPLRDFLNTYIEGASVFALSDGIYAYPVTVDPLVMYWNKNILAENNFLFPPETWERVVGEVLPVTTVRDFSRVVTRPALAMGDFSNIKNAFPIMSLLLIQSGSTFVSETKQENRFLYTVNLDRSTSGGVPLTNSLTFFTNFSNTNSTSYTWNRSLGLDRDLFLQEKLALYFGFGSEGRELEAKNPNLSFDVAEVPQSEGVKNKRTYGVFYGFSVPKNARNKSGAYLVAQTLAKEEYSKVIASALNMAPVYKKSIQQGSNDIYGRVIYVSAINARGWLNPSLVKSNNIFREAVDNIGANRLAPAQTAMDISKKIQASY